MNRNNIINDMYNNKNSNHINSNHKNSKINNNKSIGKNKMSNTKIQSNNNFLYPRFDKIKLLLKNKSNRSIE